jgi:hypothetical protein
MSDLSDVTVRASIPLAGMRPDAPPVTVERTPYVQALIDSGKLIVIHPTDDEFVTAIAESLREPLPPQYGAVAGEPAAAEGSQTGGDADDLDPPPGG